MLDILYAIGLVLTSIWLQKWSCTQRYRFCYLSDRLFGIALIKTTLEKCTGHILAITFSTKQVLSSLFLNRFYILTFIAFFTYFNNVRFTVSLRWSDSEGSAHLINCRRVIALKHLISTFLELCHAAWILHPLIIVSLSHIPSECHFTQLFQCHLTSRLRIWPLFLIHIVFGDDALWVQTICDCELGFFESLLIRLYLLVARKLALLRWRYALIVYRWWGSYLFNVVVV